jgi:hypothetical protein
MPIGLKGLAGLADEHEREVYVCSLFRNYADAY